MTIEKELGSILNKAKVSVGLQKIWMENFGFLSVQEKIDFLTILRESNASEILKTSYLLDKKIDAFKNSDTKKLEEIINEEVEYIRYV